MLPVESAERVVRTVLSYSSSCILGLFTDDDGVREYNILAIFRLHADVAGLQRYADSVAAVPRLRVRAQQQLCGDDRVLVCLHYKCARCVYAACASSRGLS